MPFYNVGLPTGPGGVSVGQNWQDFSSSDDYQKQQDTIKKIATLQAPASLPPWLTTNPDSLMKELMTQYGRVPGMVNAQGISKAYDNAIGTTEGMGGQIANNAASEAVARGGLSGGQVNSEMVKAQSMLPVYDATSKLKTDKASAVLEARKSQTSIMAGIAAQMANLRTSYLTNLGNIQTGRQNQQNSWVLSQQQLRDQQVQQQRQYALTLEQLANHGNATGGGSPGTYPWAAGAVKTPAGVSSPGYITNSGPINPAMFMGSTMGSPSQGWDGSKSAIAGWGAGSLGGGNKAGAPEPNWDEYSADDWMRMLA
jgi:hypothetical protein